MTKLTDISYSQFGTLTEEDWLKISVCEVKIPSPQGEHCKNRSETPYDPQMGVLENGVPCGTCGYSNIVCPGHFGHIVLPVPVYNNLFKDYILKILQSICPFCSRTRIKPEHARMSGMLDLSSRKRLRVFAEKCDKITICPWEDCCDYRDEDSSNKLPLFDFKDEFRIYYTDKKNATSFSAGRAYNIFCRMSNETINTLGFNHQLSWNNTFIDEDNLNNEDKFHVHQFHPKSLIFTVLPVIPPFSRPFVVRDGQKCDDDLTDKYNTILKICKKLNTFEKLSEMERKSKEAELQLHIQTLIYNKDNKSKLSSGGRPHKCLHQRIQGKEGHIQGNIVGKRVDFTARSVIVGGGIDLTMDYLGVPECIAKEETKKEYARNWNIHMLQKLVEEGKVNRVIRDGTTRRINALPDGGVEFILQIGDCVERQLQNDDIVLFNRQPTLRMESMLAFKVKIVKGRAFRLGLCWTSSFNADFDGDEMNLHIPQSIGATVEAGTIMRASANIISGQRNSPVNGIVQDGLVGAFLLTNTWENTKPTFVTKNVFFQVIESAGISDERRISLLERAEIYYPKYVKNGKIQKNKIPGKILASVLFPTDFCYERNTDVNALHPVVKIYQGILLPDSGPLCKKTIGARASSIIHILWKNYCPQSALQFLSDTQQLMDHWLPTHGFSMGISDCMSNSQDEASKMLADMQANVDTLLERCGGVPDDSTEAEINGILNSAMNVGLKLAKTAMIKGERNALNIMRNSGAKGSVVNLVSIAFFVGQQNVSGKRITCNLSSNSRTLPHFKNGDNSAAARGFVTNGYLHGLSPQEVFFHSAGGRQGIIATAIKTARTGYVQKCIGRKVEDLTVRTDGTVRNSNDRIIQFLYGDDGMDPKKLCYAKNIDMPFFVNPHTVATLINCKAKRQGSTSKKRTLLPDERNLLLSFISAGPPQLRTEITEQVTTVIRKEFKDSIKNLKIHEEFIPEFCSQVRKALESSKAQYGDSVGLIAASSIGEPSTQLSVSKDTRVILCMEDETGEANYINGEIGEIVDKLLNDKSVIPNTIELSKNSVVGIPSVPIYVMTVGTENEKTEWKPLSEISRHPTNGDLIKVTTSTGRTITTTLTHSHLSRTEEGRIVPTVAEQLVIGDRIPVLREFPYYSCTDYPDKGFLSGYTLGTFLISKTDNPEYHNIPSYAYFCTDEFISGLLRGVFDEGCYLLKVKSLFRNLLEQISILLSRFGIISEIKEKHCIIPECYAKSFLENIGTSIPLREKMFRRKIQFQTRNTVDIVSNVRDMGNVTRAEIYKKIKRGGLTTIAKNKLIQAAKSGVFWDKIIKIEHIADPKEFVYDFGVEGNHTFLTQSGIFVHNTLNTFHSAGQKGKDVSLGIPRLVELLNATKAEKQKKASCTVYFNDPILEKMKNLTCDANERIKKFDSPQDSKIVKDAKEISLSKITELKSQFQEVKIECLFRNYEMMYIEKDLNPQTDSSPVKLSNYKQYEKEWWVNLYEELNEPPEIKASHWVLVINLDMEELYRKDITVEEVSKIINESSEGKYISIPSPNILSKVEVYCDFAEISDFIKSMDGENEGWITSDNVNFFICRDIALKYIKDLPVSGIKGVGKVFPRETETSEWVLDLNCDKVTSIISVKRFLSILIQKGVDATRTLCDDMHSIYAILGIEATRKFIIEEMTRIISFDGTYINPRHIQLLVEGMTHTGKITSVRRDGISRGVGPNAKIMFEKAVDNAAEAAVFTESDMMNGIMSSVMYGMTAKCGTGRVNAKSIE